MLEKLTDQEKEVIVGGEYITAQSIMALMSVLALLVSIYKIYASSKGQAKIGNDYSFEWA